MPSRLPIVLVLFALGGLTGAGGFGIRSVASAEVTLSSGTSVCPAKLPANPLSSRPGATLVLVPAGATALLLCSYHGINSLSRSGKLDQARRVTGASELSQLTHEFDTLPKAPRGIFCPMDDGSAILATFSYSDAPSNPVSVGLTGCQIVTNGHVTRTAARTPGPALVAELTALVG